MTQRWVPAVFVRGGTSKGLFFHDRDLPADGAERDALFLAALGSPDPHGRQLDGMGGGLSSLSKVVVVRQAGEPDVDVEYAFSQVDVGTAVVDHSTNCGNLSSAVGPFAVDEGLVAVADGEVTLRLRNTDTGALIHSTFRVTDGVADTAGGLRIPGVAGRGAPIELRYLDPAGSRTGRLLPTGRVCDELRTAAGAVRVSLVDAAMPTVFVAAADVGLTGAETPEALDAASELPVLDAVRRAGAVAMGLCDDPADAPLGAPKIAVVAPARGFLAGDGSAYAARDTDLLVRAVSMGRAHRALPGTVAMCCAVAARLPGGLVHELAAGPATGSPVRIGCPSGVVTADAQVEARGPEVSVRSASLFRTARPLMRGAVALG
ncbi:hypothetical protein ND486_27935 [Pseudonocardia sp. DR1-2]|uniref:2-methylaconitate cis-trans isomerase PrpF family protein n=1 Tax=Pseudonocardia sp. DR1-2 TaxID=2951168 RepID=UPI0020430D0F|nr:PrpF domain-containing protein [Pseudonocardia sp. DR1-2]MCM3850027.1 hypothetical protein [Pseudonocardia sp. DR1-2]